MGTYCTNVSVNCAHSDICVLNTDFIEITSFAIITFFTIITFLEY